MRYFGQFIWGYGILPTPPPITKPHNSHRLCMVKMLSTHYLRYLQLDLFHTTYIRARMTSKFSQIRPLAAELSSLERLKKNPHGLIMGKWCPCINFVICHQIFLYLQRTKTGTRAWISSKICRI